MKIEHIAMYVRDLEESKRFFERYFGAVSGNRYQNLRTGFSSYFLSFSDGSRLEIMHSDDVDYSQHPLRFTGYIHTAFSLGSKERVDELTAELCADGYTVISGPRTTGDGYYESCILDGEGNQIELTV